MATDFVTEHAAWLGAYLAELQAAMNLGHWEITLTPGWVSDEGEHIEACEGSEIACVWRSNDYFDAKLYINGAQVRDRAHFRASLVHELVHLHLRDYDIAIEAVEPHLGPPVWSVVSHSLRHEMEQAVDGIARPWARALPLPPADKGLA